MNENTVLTVAEQEAQKALAQLDPSDLMPAGVERLEPGDTGMPPRLRISQPNRPIKIGDDKVEPGLIVNTLTGQTWTDLDVVVLVFLTKTRVMWPLNFSADNVPECLSDNGEYPAEPSDVRQMTKPLAGPCDECREAQFGADGDAPRCKKQRNFLVWLVEQKEPAILTMQSTALRAARHLTTLARTKGLRSSVLFTTTSVEDNRGSWVIPAFTAGRRLTASEILELVEVRGELQNLVVGADVELVEVEEAPDEPTEPMPF